MKMFGVVNGKPIAGGEVERFIGTFACLTQDDLDREVAFWVVKHVTLGWTPVSDFLIHNKAGESKNPVLANIYEVMYMAFYVGPEEAKKIPVRFLRRD